MTKRLNAGVFVLALFAFLWFAGPALEPLPALVSLVVALLAGAAACAEAMRQGDDG